MCTEHSCFAISCVISGLLSGVSHASLAQKHLDSMLRFQEISPIKDTLHRSHNQRAVSEFCSVDEHNDWSIVAQCLVYCCSMIDRRSATNTGQCDVVVRTKKKMNARAELERFIAARDCRMRNESSFSPREKAEPS